MRIVKRLSSFANGLTSSLSSKYFSSEYIKKEIGIDQALAREITNLPPEGIMPYKMLFVVNGSLRMNSGEVAGQVAHCAIDLYQKLIERKSTSVNDWYEDGETKIVVRSPSIEELLNIESRAKRNSSIVISIMKDPDQSEIASDAITCLGLFGRNEELNPITGHLKLMQDCLKCHGN